MSDRNQPARLPEAAQVAVEIRQLHRDHAAALTRYAAAMLPHSEGGPDAVQEVFLRYFIERTYGRTIENPRAWLYRVLRNYLLDTLKTAESKQSFETMDLDRFPDDRQDPEARLDSSQVALEIASLLSPREREVLALRGGGMCYEEIAALLGLRVGTVGALLARAYGKVRGRSAGAAAGDNRRVARALHILVKEGPVG